MSQRKTMLYTQQAMQQALDEVRNGTPVGSASKKYGVPKTTLLYKSRGDLPINCRKGPATILTTDEEKALVQWLLYIGDKGFPASKIQLLELLVKITKRSTSFVNGRPGRKWYSSFMKRHPIIAERISQNLTAARSSVTENKIRSWFSEITEYIKTEGLESIWGDPTRVYNADETAFFLAPKGQKVLVRKGESTVYNHINNDEKENLTTLINANAAGMMVPPLIVFKYERIPPHISNLMPNDWAIAKSESGWMTGTTFYEYVTNVFYPWLVKNNVTFPIAFFVDGHKSHLTLSLSDFCTEKQIILIALYPNATHLLQPMDVAVFRPLKSGWKDAVRKWRIVNNGAQFKKEHFGGVLQEAINVSISPEIISNGFKCTGLFPLNPDAINYKKYFKGSENGNIDQNINHEERELIKKFLNYMEKNISKETLNEFKKTNLTWTGNLEETSMFNFWKKTSAAVNELNSTDYNNSTTVNNGGRDISRVEEEMNLENNLIAEIATPVPSENPHLDSLNRSLATSPLLDAENLEKLPDTSIISIHELFPDENRDIHFDNLPGTSTPIPQEKLNNSLGNTENLPTTSTCIPQQLNENLDNLQGTSPTSSVSTTNVPFNVPSPFKKYLFWPEIQQDSRPKRNKEKIPSVAISQDWKKYHLAKKQKKEQEEKDKQERKRKREEKTKLKQQTMQMKKVKKATKAPIEESSSESSIEVNVESEGEGDEWMTNAEESLNKEEIPVVCTNVKVNDYVIVEYEGGHYPGRVTKQNNKQALISVMSSSGINNWKWPTNKDEIWYSLNDVVQVIPAPIAVNKRGTFKVKELEKYSAYYLP